MVLIARGLDGGEVKMVLLQSWLMIRVTPGLTLNVVALRDDMFIASLKVAVMTAREHTPVTPLRGATEITTGGGVHALAAVVKLHTKLRANPTPNRFLARVLMAAV